MKVFFAVVAGLAATLALTWIFQGNDFFMYKYFAPKQAAVERQIFENTKSYNEGMAQEIQNMQFEYIKATPDQQKALKSIILHRTANYDITKLPVDTQQFINHLRNNSEISR